MDVVLPVVVGVSVALATTAVFVFLRSQAGRWRDARLNRVAGLSQRPGAAEGPATASTVVEPRRLPVGVKDQSIQVTPDVPRRPRRATSARKAPASRGGSRPAPPGKRSAPRSPGANMKVDAPYGMEVVQAQADVVTNQVDDRDMAADDDPAPVMDARNIYWQTDGSTDCASCSSSRLRGASFCIRCGRRLVEA